MTYHSLIDCINLFAVQHSNPVLSVLPDDGVVEFKRKYPEPKLSFSGIGLRAYYHCHTSESRPDMEHGHFHIFLKTDKDQWSHLAGLSMDNLGQPLQWFTVNQWVTGESWNQAKQLEYHLDKLLAKKTPELGLVETWMLAMLEFYRKTVKEILTERDQKIKIFSQDQNNDKALQDRSIYLLSQQNMSLLTDLESYANITDIQHYNA